MGTVEIHENHLGGTDIERTFASEYKHRNIKNFKIVSGKSRLINGRGGFILRLGAKRKLEGVMVKGKR